MNGTACRTLAVIVAAFFAVTATAVVADVDMTGDYWVDWVGGIPDVCTATVGQSGTALTFDASCIGGNFYTATGTINPTTGAFTLTGTCDASGPPPGTPGPFAFTGTASLDSLTFTMSGTCQGVEVAHFGTKCGNGIADAGEECEDGNRDNGDCCSSSCTADTGQVCSAATPPCTLSLCNSAAVCVPEAADEPAGAACDLDADSCTVDVCDGAGTCESTGQAVDCGSCETCDTAQGCVANWPENIDPHATTPGECRASGRENAKLGNNFANDDRDGLRWNWKRSEAFPVTDFGSPMTTTAYTLCIFGQGNAGDRAILGEIEIPPGPGWTSAPGGFRYDNNLVGVGKVKIDLRSSLQDLKPQIKVKVRGAGLDYPTVLDDAVQPNIRVGALVLSADNGNCWASSMGVEKASGANAAGEKIKLRDCYSNFQSCR